MVLKLLNLFVFESLAWKINSMRWFQINMCFNLERAQTSEHCYRLLDHLCHISPITCHQRKKKNIHSRDGQAARKLKKLEPQPSSFEPKAWTRPEWDSSLRRVIRLKILLGQAFQDSIRKLRIIQQKKPKLLPFGPKYINKNVKLLGKIFFFISLGEQSGISCWNAHMFT